MALNESLSDYERSKLAVWDYPISDKFTKMWQSMKKSGLPQTFDDAVLRIGKTSLHQFVKILYLLQAEYPFFARKAIGEGCQLKIDKK